MQKTASAIPSLEGLRKSCGLTSEVAGYAASGASINQKSPIINSNFSKISGFPPQAGGVNYPASRNPEILGKSIFEESALF